MARTDKRETRSCGRGLVAALCVAVFGSLLTAGCVNDPRVPGSPLRNDPLRGGGAPVEVTGRGGTAGPTPGFPASNPSGGSGTPGSLSSLDSSRSLHIDGANTSPPPDRDEWKGPGVASEPKPEPPEPTTARGMPSSFDGGGGLRVATYEQAQSMLASRGVTWQRLETWGDEGEWKFSCRVPKPGNQYMARAYEARAREPILAMRAVLEQIDRER